MSILHTFSALVHSSNSFDGKEDDEQVVLVVRPHPFFLCVQLAIFLFLAALPLGFSIFYSGFLVSIGLAKYASFILILWWLLLWQISFYAITMYLLDVWIVTDKRVIDSTQHGFFSRTVAELHLSRIQDVSVTTSGLFQTLLHFGDVDLQTAGTVEKFKFVQVPHPDRIREEIMRLVAEEVKGGQS